MHKTKVSSTIENSLPDFYKEYGSEFITFVKAYYKWLESNNYIAASAGIPENLDIDTTSAEFLIHFKNEYMNGLSNDIVGNQRLLQKHILDLYRSKGSEAGLKLFFNLLYSKNADIYYPGDDLFKTSDNVWYLRKFIEIDDTAYNVDYNNIEILGEVSGATAFVESYEIIQYGNKRNHVLWVSNINGQFLVGERLYTSEHKDPLCPVIKGSITGVEVTFSSLDLQLGQQFQSVDDPNLKFYASKLNESLLYGILDTTFVSGGAGYRVGINHPVVVTPNTIGTPAQYSITGVTRHDDTITTTYTPLLPYVNTALSVADYGMPFAGSNINTIISSALPFGTYQVFGNTAQGITETSTTITLTSELINPYANVTIGAADYGMPVAGSNANTIVQNAMQFTTYNLGPVANIVTIDVGSKYSTVVDVRPTDSVIARLEARGSNGAILGKNSYAIGNPTLGYNRVSEVTMYNSLFGYSLGPITLVNSEGKIISGKIQIGAIGSLEGYFGNTSGFLGADKYLQDNYYYQEYSYDIIIDEKFSEYFDTLKKIIHPAGKKAFGNDRLLIKLDDSKNVTGTLTSQSDFYIWMLRFGVLETTTDTYWQDSRTW